MCATVMSQTRVRAPRARSAWSSSRCWYSSMVLGVVADRDRLRLVFGRAGRARTRGRESVDAAAHEPAVGELRQGLVRSGLLVERLVEERARPVEPELACERPRRAVGGDLVVLDPLARADQRGIERDRVPVRPGDVVAVGDETLHRLARLRRREPDAHLGEDLLQPIDVHARLLEVRLEGITKLVRMRGRGQPRQCVDELPLGAVQIPDLLDQHVGE